MINAWKHPEHKVEIALVGKYVSLHDAYISVVESLEHAGVANSADVKIRWVDSERISSYNVDEMLGGVHGILVPGGFGDRGIEGMICAIKYARKQDPISWTMLRNAAYISRIRKTCLRIL